MGNRGWSTITNMSRVVICHLWHGLLPSANRRPLKKSVFSEHLCVGETKTADHVLQEKKNTLFEACDWLKGAGHASKFTYSILVTIASETTHCG